MVKCCKCGVKMNGNDSVIVYCAECYCPDCFADYILPDYDPAYIAERIGLEVADAEDFYEDGPENYFSEKELL